MKTKYIKFDKVENVFFGVKIKLMQDMNNIINNGNHYYDYKVRAKLWDFRIENKLMLDDVMGPINIDIKRKYHGARRL